MQHICFKCKNSWADNYEPIYEVEIMWECDNCIDLDIFLNSLTNTERE